MNNFLFDLFPIILFFIVFKIWGIYAATAVAIAASIIQVVYTRLKQHKYDKMQIATLVLIVFFGGATLIFHNPLFIQWKVSILYWLFAVIFLGSHFIGHKPLVQRLMEQQIQLPKKVWQRLSWSWIIFFTALGFVNLYVMFHYSMDFWVNFKLFGILGLTLVFFIAQGIYLMRHLKHHD